uniref:Uncharacterized protein n=1 Tax=Anguilla anguilla TaxID=7936 RepID=A0A0E9XS41_ANGAN
MSFQKQTEDVLRPTKTRGENWLVRGRKVCAPTVTQ